MLSPSEVRFRARRGAPTRIGSRCGRLYVTAVAVARF
jgi:hypothetical protein